MSVKIREIENGLMATIGDREYAIELIATTSCFHNEQAVEIEKQIRAAILKRMGEGEGGAQWLTASEIEAAGWLPPDEAKEKNRQLAKLMKELAEANERVEELEALRLPTPAGTRLQEAYENQTETIIRLNKHIKELQAELTLTSRYSPCSCVCGPIEPMEDAPRNMLYTSAILKDDIGDSEWIKFYANAGDGKPIGFARIRRENLEVK